MDVSVILCSRNPRPAVLGRVLSSLAAQSLTHSAREVIVVDNGSEPPLSLERIGNLANMRIVVEPLVGLTAARIRGIHEARRELVVFVDDDNLLDPNYLETALRIAQENPQIGAFGGRISAEFEASPPDWVQPFLSHVAVIDVPRDQWTNNPADHSLIPCGAGLCMRRQAAVAYADAAQADPQRLALDRSGSSMMSCGDTDMVLSCVDAGWGMGRFTALHLTHVIPASRLEFGYQKQLAADIGYSYGRLLAIRGEASRGRRAIALAKTVLAFLGVKHRGRARLLDLAYHYGVWKGLR